MKHKHVLDALELRNVEEDDVNPLRVAINFEFNRKGNPKGDYRDRAIERCLDKRVGFASESNTLRDVVKRVIRVNCPKCNQIMTASDTSGGDSQRYSMSYRCTDKECDCKVTLTLPYDAINISFPEDVLREKEASAENGVTYCGSH